VVSKLQNHTLNAYVRILKYFIIHMNLIYNGMDVDFVEPILDDFYTK